MQAQRAMLALRAPSNMYRFIRLFKRSSAPFSTARACRFPPIISLHMVCCSVLRQPAPLTPRHPCYAWPWSRPFDAVAANSNSFGCRAFTSYTCLFYRIFIIVCSARICVDIYPADCAPMCALVNGAMFALDIHYYQVENTINIKCCFRSAAAFCPIEHIDSRKLLPVHASEQDSCGWLVCRPCATCCTRSM